MRAGGNWHNELKIAPLSYATRLVLPGGGMVDRRISWYWMALFAAVPSATFLLTGSLSLATVAAVWAFLLAIRHDAKDGERK